MSGTALQWRESDDIDWHQSNLDTRFSVKTFQQLGKDQSFHDPVVNLDHKGLSKIPLLQA